MPLYIPIRIIETWNKQVIAPIHAAFGKTSKGVLEALHGKYMHKTEIRKETV